MIAVSNEVKSYFKLEQQHPKNYSLKRHFDNAMQHIHKQHKNKMLKFSINQQLYSKHHLFRSLLPNHKLIQSSTDLFRGWEIVAQI